MILNPSRSWPMFLALAAFAAGNLCSGAVLSVSPDGTGEFPNIQSAIDAASPGDVVELRDGVYSGPGNTSLQIRGGPITIRSQSEDARRCAIDYEADSALTEYPSEALVLFFPEGTQAEVIGIMFTRAGREGPISNSIRISAGCNIRFRNCVFRLSRAANGVISIGRAESVSVENCAFEWNQGSAGQLTASGISCNETTVRVTDSVFYGNSGAPSILLWESRVEVDNCDFVHNRSLRRGVIGSIKGRKVAGSGLRVTNCRFRENEGAGIYANHIPDLLVENSEFTGNTQVEKGAITIFDGDAVTIRGCVFVKNIDSGIHIREGQRCVVEQSTFVENHATHGGGAMRFEDSSVEVSNCLAVGNSGVGTVSCDGGDISVECCNFYDNSFEDWFGCVQDELGTRNNFSEDPLFCDEPNSLAIRDDSPCAPDSEYGEECGLIGALPVSCMRLTPIVETSWGRVKADFRKMKR